MYIRIALLTALSYLQGKSGVETVHGLLHVVLPARSVGNRLLFTPRHSQSLLTKALPPLRGSLLLPMRLQDAMLMEMALPTYIHAGKFSCETENHPQECTSGQ